MPMPEEFDAYTVARKIYERWTDYGKGAINEPLAFGLLPQETIDKWKAVAMTFEPHLFNYPLAPSLESLPCTRCGNMFHDPIHTPPRAPTRWSFRAMRSTATLDSLLAASDASGAKLVGVTEIREVKPITLEQIDRAFSGFNGMPLNMNGRKKVISALTELGIEVEP